MIKTIRYVFSRFGEMKQLYAPASSSCLTIIYFFDWLFSLVVYGSSISDYFAFSFYNKNHSGRIKYITYRKYKRIQKIANERISIDVCRSKSEFNKTFHGFLGRDTINLSDVSKADFKQWVSIQTGSIFIKDAYSFRGKGVRKIKIEGIDIEKLYDELINDKDSYYVIEQELIQDSALAKFHPWSVNTIRVVTLYDTTNDEVHIMDAGLRLGNNKHPVDNFHFGGIYGQIDIQSGVICNKAFNTSNEQFVNHPLTGMQIVGFKIKNWEGLLNYVRTAARMIPKVRYVGWDIVILENGDYALIEANDNADHDLQQMYRGGLWSDYKKILKRLKK